MSYSDATFFKILKKFSSCMEKGCTREEAKKSLLASFKKNDVEDFLETSAAHDTIRTNERGRRMTKELARERGEHAAVNYAGGLFTDPDYHQLAEVLRKWRKPSTWKSISSSDIEHEMIRAEVPPEFASEFRKGFLSGGPEAIEKEIAHAVKTGYLKEV